MIRIILMMIFMIVDRKRIKLIQTFWILVKNTNTNPFGSNGKFDKAQVTLLPRDEWDKPMNLNVNKSKPFQPKRQVKSHHVSDTVNFDDIIDYTINTHKIAVPSILTRLV
jgi:hypothetical protein